MTLDELAEALINSDKRVDVDIEIGDAHFLARGYFVGSTIRIDLLPIYPNYSWGKEAQNAKR